MEKENLIKLKPIDWLFVYGAYLGSFLLVFINLWLGISFFLTLLCASLCVFVWRKLWLSPVLLFLNIFHLCFFLVPARFHEWPAIWLLLPSIVMSPFYLFSQKRISNYFKLLSLKSISLMHLGMALMIFLLWTLMSTFLAIYSGGVGPENLFSAATSIEKVWMIVLIVIPIYSLTNALGEEIVFRGIFLSESWKKLRLPLMTPLIIQALLFASYQNILGIQSGMLGLILSFSVGFSLGLLRLQSANLSLAIIANFLQSFVSSLVLTLMLV